MSGIGLLNEKPLHASLKQWYARPAFVPMGLNSFTTDELAAGISANRVLAQKLAYSLRHGQMIEMIGRRGRANLYRVAEIKN